MFSLDCLYIDVSKILENSKYEIVKIIKDEVYFGNIIVIIRNEDKLNLKFVNEKSIIWCEIKFGDYHEEWFTLDDVLEYLKINKNNESHELLDSIKQTIEIIEENYYLLYLKFLNGNCYDNLKKLKLFEKEKAYKRFNISK